MIILNKKMFDFFIILKILALAKNMCNIATCGDIFNFSVDKAVVFYFLYDQNIMKNPRIDKFLDYSFDQLCNQQSQQ